CFSQTLVQKYEPAIQDSLKVGAGANDYLPYIQSGYTLMLPEEQRVRGVLIFLEDSEIDLKNKNAKQLYEQASHEGFAVLSVSSELPLDFYFSESSMQTAHQHIHDAFSEHNLPNTNVFFLGGSLVGHRAIRYIKFLSESNAPFRPEIKGIVMCHFTLDWTRKWYQHQRDIRINRINLWEPRFINYMLETQLQGTPKTAPERYHEFSPYSYFDEKNENVNIYKNVAIRAYVQPDITYRLNKYHRTLYDNNAPDMVGFIAEVQLAGNERAELIVLHPDNNAPQEKKVGSTWDTIDKNELMDWIVEQMKKN
ncbi:MAG: hypothetical protein AAF466_03210, partial [Bacteroidota bacterium]